MSALIHEGREVAPRIISPRTQDAADNRRRLRQSYDAGDIVFVVKSANGRTHAIASSKSNPGTWHHVAPGEGCDCLGFERYGTCRHYVRVMWIRQHGWNPYAGPPEEEKEE